MSRSAEKQTVIITGASDGLGAALLNKARLAGFQTVNIARRSHPEATHNIQTAKIAEAKG